MRRIAQSATARDGGSSLGIADLDDMLFAGGRLNAKLLGGAREVGRIRSGSLTTCKPKPSVSRRGLTGR